MGKPQAAVTKNLEEQQQNKRSSEVAEGEDLVIASEV